MTPVVHYDPLGREFRVDYPDGTYTRRQFDAWRHEVWDQSDTVADSRWHEERQDLAATIPDRRADQLAAAHAGTPTTIHLDSRGRDVLAISTDGVDSLETRVGLDAAGRTRTLTDARGVLVMEARYDALGRRLHVESVDGGESRGLPDVSGAMIRSWNGRGIAVRAAYDDLGRLTDLYVREGAGAERLVERTVYGELLPDAVDRNLRARPFRVYDAAGAATTEALDFAGNVLRANRRLPSDPAAIADWSILRGPSTIAQIEAAADPLLEDEELTTTTEYDAFGRPIGRRHPRRQRRDVPAYDEAGLLGSIGIRLRGAAAATTFVAETAHNARGQRERVRFGNGVTSTYTYDARSFRLARIESVLARRSGGAGPSLHL